MGLRKLTTWGNGKAGGWGEEGWEGGGIRVRGREKEGWERGRKGERGRGEEGWGLVVVWLLWLSVRTLAAQTRGVLGLTHGDSKLFHFPLFLNFFIEWHYV